MAFNTLNKLFLLFIASLIFFISCQEKPGALELDFKMSNPYARSPVTVEFIAGSGMLAENITYQWYINKVLMQTNQKRMKFIFKEPGEYVIEVYMLSTNKPPLYKAVSLQVAANQLPDCDFSFTEPAFVGDLVHFTPQCVDVDGKVVKYRWDFGDGKTSSIGRNRFTTPGAYLVTLYATDDANGIKEISKRVVIRAK